MNAEDSDHQTISGRVKIIQMRFCSEASLFKVAVAEAVTPLGGNLPIGSHLTIRGNVEVELKIGDEFDILLETRRDVRFGIQYEIIYCDIAPPSSEEGLRKYFINNFTGIGEKRARLLIKEFGESVITLLEGKESDAVEIISERLKWTTDASLQFVKQWQKAILPKKSEFLLLGAGINTGQISRIKETFGEDFPEILKNNPYRLAQIGGIGFPAADRIARRQGAKADAPERIWAAASHELKESSLGGDCFLPERDLIAQISKKLKLGSELIAGILEGFFPETEPIFKDLDGNWWLLSLYEAENTAAEFLSRLIKNNRNQKSEVSGTDWQRIKAHFEIETGINLDGTQTQAVRRALEENVLIITGNPGTGKTTILKAVISALEYTGSGRVALCAPTGKAARRMAESTERETTTIHRLLGITPEGICYSHLNTLPVDAVIVDEMSMVDILLFARLVSALKPETKLIFVGDSDQLSSVGAGRVLTDLLEAGISQIRLTEPQRQAKNSFIIRLAHSVNNGKLPDLPECGSSENVWFADSANESDGKKILGSLLHNFAKAGFSAADLKCLSPQKKGNCGVNELNIFLQEIVNPQLPQKNEINWKNGVLREGDNLIQLKNDRSLDLMNGEEVRVRRISFENDGQSDIGEGTYFAEITTDDGRALTLPVKDLVMQHANCLTIHKAQGSEWEIVIIFCLSSQLGFYTRKMLYTGLTRARKLAVIIGNRESLRTVVGRERETRRRTKLTERLRRKLVPQKLCLS